MLLLFLFIYLILFLALPAFVIWRLYRVPLTGDIQMKLLWRGAVAGVTGAMIGATLSLLIFGGGVHAEFLYLYGPIFTVVAGMAFTLIIGASQKRLNINLPGRIAIGAVTGTGTALLWIYGTGPIEPMNWVGKASISMIICTGVVSGILSGPTQKD
jgi:hypothetical protein